MLDSIEISNWKTHKSTKLEFQKGVNVLIGVMGAGKSSVMDAISFALFGTFPALLSKRVTQQNLLMNRPTVATEAEVKLGFQVGEDAYTVTRKIGGTGNSAKLEKNGAYLQTQPTKVTEEIESVLKIDYDTFSRVVYAEQNSLDYFLELAKGERKRQIDHMLGLDTFVTAEENVTSLVNTVRSAISYEEETLSKSNVKEMRDALRKIDDEAAALSAEQKKTEKEEVALTKELDSDRKNLDSARAQMEKKKKLADESLRLQSKISTLNDEIKRISALKIDAKSVEERKPLLEKRAKEIASEVEISKKEERAAATKVANLEAEIKQNERRLAERERLAASLKGESEDAIKKEVEKHDHAVKVLFEEIAARKSKSKEIAELMGELEKHTGKCPVCEQELTPEHKRKLLESRKAQHATTETEIKELTETVNTTAENLRRLRERHSSITIAASKISDYKDVDKLLEKAAKELAVSRREQSDANARSEKATKEHDRARDELAKLKADEQTVERLKTYEREIKSATEQFDLKKKEVAAIEMDEKTIYSLQETITKISSTLGEMRTRLQERKRYIDSLESQAKEKRRQVDDIERMEKRIATKQKQVANLNKFKIALVETEAVLRNRLVSSINGLMQSAWLDLYPYSDYSNIRLTAKKDDYLLEVNTGRGGEEAWMQVDGIASGGERSTACLAMRIALAMVVVPNLRWLILDEPTHNIDSTGINKFIEVLGDSLPKVVDQIFIITHDDNLKQITSARVYELHRDKAAAAPTTILEI